MSHINESCHVWMSGVPRRPRPVLTCMYYVWMSHVTYKWVMSHMNECNATATAAWTYRFVLRMDESCQI